MRLSSALLEATGPAEGACVLTAHPAKFEETVRQAGVPDWKLPKVEAMKTMAQRFEWLRAPTGDHTRAAKLEQWVAHLRRAVEAAAKKHKK